MSVPEIELQRSPQDILYANLVSQTNDVLDTYNYWLSIDFKRQLESKVFTIPPAAPEFICRLELVGYGDLPSHRQLTPQMCRLKSMTYDMSVYVKLMYKPYKHPEQSWIQYIGQGAIDGTFSFLSIPLMLGSAYCMLSNKSSLECMQYGEDFGDPFGYFIAKGTDRTLFGQVSLRKHMPLLIPITSYPAYGPKEIEGKDRGLACTMTCDAGLSTQIVLVTMTPFRTMRASVMSFRRQMMPIYSLFKIASRFILTNEQITEMIKRWVQPDNRKAVDLILMTCILEADNFFPGWLEAEGLFRFLEWKITRNNTLQPLQQKENEMGQRAAKKQLIHNELVRDLYPNISIENYNVLFPIMYRQDEDILTIDDYDIIPETIDDIPLLLWQKLETFARACAMMGELIAGKRQTIDRDSWINKRLENAASACATIGGRLIDTSINRILYPTRDNTTPPSNPTDFITALIGKRGDLSRDFIHSISITSVGGMVKSKSRYGRENLSDMLSRDSNLAERSALSQIKTPTSSHASKPSIRDVQGSQYGFICVDETPDGENIGLVIHKAATARITIRSSEEELYPILFGANPPLLPLVEQLPMEEGKEVIKVCMNGKYIGYTAPENNLHLTLLAARRGQLAMSISSDVAIYNHEGVIDIYTDGSRLVRPLIILKDGKTPLLTDSALCSLSPLELVSKGLIEYIDAREVECLNLSPYGKPPTYITIAQTVKDLESYPPDRYTHMEIHPLSLCGVVASCSPWRDHQQAPRNNFNSSMTRQALTIRTQLFGYTGSSYKILLTPSRPLVDNIVNVCWNNDIFPPGTNAIIAFDTYKGDNQEDAIIMCKNARKLFPTGKFSNYTILLGDSKSLYKDFLEFPTVVNRDDKRYRHICRDENRKADGVDASGKPIKVNSVIGQNIYGVAELGTHLKTGDCVVVKRRVSNDTEKELQPKQSCTYVTVENDGIVFDIQYYVADGGVGIVIVTTKSVRLPHIGDKFAAPHAQKGVVGVIRDKDDMFSVAYGPDKGMVPDIVTNPHSIPSRMTIGWMAALLIGKAAAITGKSANATSFADYHQTLRDAVETIKKRYNRYVDKLIGSDAPLKAAADARRTTFPLIEMREERRTIIDTIGDNKDDALQTMKAAAAATEAALTAEIAAIDREIVTDDTELASMLTYRYYSAQLQGREIMMHPITKEEIETPINIGVCFYMSLRHHTKDKAQAVGINVPRSLTTRQPIGGRPREGGLKTGEMERDSFFSHGAAFFTIERLMEQSDKYTTVSCSYCGTIAVADVNGIKRYCGLCKNDPLAKDRIMVRTTYSYVYKLLMYLLGGAGISVRNTLRNKPAIA